MLVACAFDIISRMHSSVVSLPDDPIQLMAEVIQLRDVLKEKPVTLSYYYFDLGGKDLTIV